MPKKRKAEANGLDEMDRELYGTFRTAANSISALYTSSLSLQKRAFNAGARHATTVECACRRIDGWSSAPLTERAARLPSLPTPTCTSQ